MPGKVYVISRLGHPLMPCSPAKARHLLDDGKAKVVKRTPFTIKLLYGSTEYTQPVILGVDAGSKTIGLSASTTKEELFAAEVMPRNDVVENLSTRREFRRARRNRTTRYRKPRFNNRVHSKNNGWLAPSVEVKISKICDGFPVFDSENQYLIALRELLKYTMQDQYDYIGWWLYEAPDAGYTVWWDDEDGKEIRVDLTEPGALYDYLVEYAAPEGVQEDEL